MPIRPAPGHDTFTFIEIVVVILVLGIIAAVALPALDASVSTARLDRATGEVLGALVYARERSLSSGQACRVTIDAQVDTVVVERLVFSPEIADPSVDQLPAATVEASSYAVLPYPPNPTQPYRIQLTDAGGFGGAEISQVQYGVGSAVTFDAFGMPSCDLGVVITHRGQTSWVAVNAKTGAIDSGR